jgi:hypothetical protein
MVRSDGSLRFLNVFSIRVDPKEWREPGVIQAVAGTHAG